MALNLLAISIGNTHIRFGAFVDDELEDAVAAKVDQGEAEIERLAAKVVGRPNAACLIGSVHPSAAQRITTLAERHFPGDVHRVEQDVPVAIGRQLDREAMVGDDRLLNAAAAFDATKQACAVVDAGTAVTVDFVDGAGTYHGGAILPGRAMMLDALAQGTAQLPEVAWQRPEEAIGHNTQEAIRSGIFHGLRGAVRELIETFAESTGIYPLVVATGGDADILFHDYPLIEQTVPDLTLQGIAVTARSATSSAES